MRAGMIRIIVEDGCAFGSSCEWISCLSWLQPHRYTEPTESCWFGRALDKPRDYHAYNFGRVLYTSCYCWQSTLQMLCGSLPVFLQVCACPLLDYCWRWSLYVRRANTVHARPTRPPEWHGQFSISQIWQGPLSSSVYELVKPPIPAFHFFQSLLWPENLVDSFCVVDPM